MKQPRIETIAAKQLVGNRITMSFANNKTGELWRSFMPRRKEITNNITTDLISMQVYSTPPDFRNFNPNIEFEKWAAIEVSDTGSIPEGMEQFTLPGGMYAVFDYIGSSLDNSIFVYIYGTWLPNSEYMLDDRPHFEVLGEKYKNGDPNSEEEIWVPVKLL